jgi:biotin-dependent carboxylase-like uncharacterized protein
VSVEVIDPGPATSVQTPLGRRGYERFGVRVGGAADAWSARLANRLVGADDEQPLLEGALSGPTLRFDEPAVVALTGAPWRTTLDGLPFPIAEARLARRGAVLRVGSGRGMRLYVAIGGLTAPRVLGSAATDLAGGFGGHAGRLLRPGDTLQAVRRPTTAARAPAASLPGGPIRLLPGPHAGEAGIGSLTAAAWRVSREADRSGVRLVGDGTALHMEPAEVASMGLPLGAVQVPPDGSPIVMLADRPVTGGYPVPACVIAADVPRVAQLRPGDEITFAEVTRAGAVDALREAEAGLAVEQIDLEVPDDGGWVGALE